MTTKSKPGFLAYCYNIPTYQRLFPEVTWIPLVKRKGGIGETMSEELRMPSSPFCIYPIHLRNLSFFSKNNRLLCLDEYFSKIEIKRYSPHALDMCRIDGKLYAIPEDFKPYMLFSKKNILKKYGLKHALTLHELQDQLKFLRKRSGVPMLSTRGGGRSASFGFICALLGSHGVDISGNLENLIQEEKCLVDAYDWMRKVYTNGWISNFQFFLRRVAIGPFRDAFLNSEIAYHMGWPSNELPTWSEQICDDIEATLLPPARPGIQPWTPMSAHGWIIPANTQDKKIAVAILRKTQQLNLMKENELLHGMPFHACVELWKDAELLSARPFNRFRKILKEIRHSCLINTSLRKFEILDETFRQALQKEKTGEEWLKSLRTHNFNPSGKTSTTSQIVKNAVEYTQKNLGKIKGTKDVASHFGFSPRRFNDFFHQEIKMGFGIYLMQMRMERARELLEDHNLSLKEIAGKLGFKHPSYFTQAFGKYWGISPSEMIRKGS